MIRRESYKPNTVKNSLWGFIAKLLHKKLGPTKAREILDWADRPSADDRRDVVLTAADLWAVISAAAWEVRMFLLVSASTGVDVSPILRIRRRDVHFGRWKLYVQDRKTDRRTAMIDLPAVALYALHLLFEGKGEGERAFSLVYHQIYYRWRKALEAARLTPEAPTCSGPLGRWDSGSRRISAVRSPKPARTAGTVRRSRCRPGGSTRRSRRVPRSS